MQSLYFPDSVFVIFNIFVHIFANIGPIFISLKKTYLEVENVIYS